MISTFNAISINKIEMEVEIPETYELSNIILALTDYGRTDDFEVLKSTAYYQEVIKFFEPVIDHPLLDSVNFSRERWEDYLSFRTDAFAFRFGDDNKIYRYLYFFANQGHDPFDKNLNLINDFVEKSHFREFFKEHKSYYDFITENYSEYYFIDKSWDFLNNFIGKQYSETNKLKYFIVLSPLVNRMNCHRDIENSIIADFPSASPAFLNQITNNNLSDRLNGNHMIFTEMDHGFINSVSEKNKLLISEKFNYAKWDNNSGYEEIDIFNEYMTWAVWDIFIRENFPEIAGFLSLRWQIQNASRGFFASNIFSDKLLEIVSENKLKSLEDVYPPLLDWCKLTEDKLLIPAITNYEYERKSESGKMNIQLCFSESMKQVDVFEVIISKTQNESEGDNNSKVVIKNALWTDNGKKISFDAPIKFNDFVILFNSLNIYKPLVSQNNIFLQLNSNVLVENVSTSKNQLEEDNSSKKIIIAAIITGILAAGAYMLRKRLYKFLKEKKDVNT
jgi:hypothetical protein